MKLSDAARDGHEIPRFARDDRRVGSGLCARGAERAGLPYQRFIRLALDRAISVPR